MQIYIIARAFEHPVLVPAGLSNNELVTSSLQRRRVFCFACRVGHDKNDVNYRLGRETPN